MNMINRRQFLKITGVVPLSLPQPGARGHGHDAQLSDREFPGFGLNWEAFADDKRMIQAGSIVFITGA